MSSDQNRSNPAGIGVSLVDGNIDIRHARQLLLRSEDYNVRSYPTSAAILADLNSRNYPCIVLDLELDEETRGIDLLRKMRASGWRGKALLLDGLDPGGALLRQAGEHGDKVLPRNVGDQTLLTAIAASIDRGWAGWNAG